MALHHVRRGAGRPLVLLHGLGGTWRSWDPVLDALAAEREVVAVDLPGFGDSPPLPHPPTVAALADAVEAFLDEQGLRGAAAAGSSLGARLVLELARRGSVGATVALDPGGFWNRRELRYFELTIGLSIRLVRLLQPVMPAICASPVARSALFAQFSARPWALPSDVVLREMRAYAAAPALDATFRELVRGPGQPGTDGTPGPVLLVWGRRDLVTLPRQAPRAQRRFPNARLAWVGGSGHFPQWDRPEEAARLILDHTG
jgi:pimeloyl-ACP methyl ester carboxylesterase